MAQSTASTSSGGLRHEWPKGIGETEAQLLDSALTLFSEKGYDATSVREIIEQAEVSRPVLYYYFASKEDLFRRLVETMLQASGERMEAILQNVRGCRAQLVALIIDSFAAAEERPEVPRLLLQTFFSPEQKGVSEEATRLTRQRSERILRIIEGGIASGDLAVDDAGELALMFSGIMDIHVMARVRRGEPALTSEMGEMLVDRFLKGVGAGLSTASKAVTEEKIISGAKSA